MFNLEIQTHCKKNELINWLMWQSLGLETVGVKMTKSGAIEVKFLGFSRVLCPFRSCFCCLYFLCFLIRLMNFPVHLFHPFGLLEMLLIE